MNADVLPAAGNVADNPGSIKNWIFFGAALLPVTSEALIKAGKGGEATVDGARNATKDARAAEGAEKAGSCGKGTGGAPEKGMKGWQGQAPWKNAVKDVDRGGDFDVAKHGIPTEKEARKLIEEAGGTVKRVEEHAPGGVSTHTYPHINYTTKDGTKGTIRITEIDK